MVGSDGPLKCCCPIDVQIERHYLYRFVHVCIRRYVSDYMRLQYGSVIMVHFERIYDLRVTGLRVILSMAFSVLLSNRRTDRVV